MRVVRHGRKWSFHADLPVWFQVESGPVDLWNRLQLWSEAEGWYDADMESPVQVDRAGQTIFARHKDVSIMPFFHDIRLKMFTPTPPPPLEGTIPFYFQPTYT